ncbi:MAG TPA: hypothetical protein VKX35_04190 [Fermentimonas sp.]|nr:hypothetical protein [Fermentimonas sp.]
MTTGQCIIDGVDIASIGAFIERDGSNDLLMFPDRRKPDQNDWFESDGLEVDLSEVSFDAKKVAINYVIIADDYTQFKQRLNIFQNIHYKPMMNIYIREYATTFNLRYIQSSDYRHSGGYFNARKKIGNVKMDYWMDDPMQLYTSAIASPVGDPSNITHVSIDNIDLSAYGITVTEAYSSVLRPRGVKEVLTSKINSVDGQVADNLQGIVGYPKRKANEVIIDCVMTAGSKNNLLINLNALFNVVRKINAPLSLQLAGETINCYYSKMSQFRKLTPFSRKVRVEFKLHLQEINRLN